ncbi:glutamate receptor 2-like isoform X1 [Tubulanus polymorphus]|uniref:glutamate receptor 2-like isoform X1 n=1 Tax=Tubulanus polymorphus TaxID=672921 RepID=UPI003DA51778
MQLKLWLGFLWILLSPTLFCSADNGKSVHLKVVSILEEPFLRLKSHEDLAASTLSGNSRYMGYIKDLMDEVSRVAGFNYSIYPDPDEKYGHQISYNGTWDGMIGQLIGKNADVAAGALTITKKRSTVVQFSPAFMKYGISILMNKMDVITDSDESSADILYFLKPFSSGVWISLIFAWIIISLLLLLNHRFNPYDVFDRIVQDSRERQSQQNNNCFHEMRECFWLALTGFLYNGSWQPRSLASRSLMIIWWMFRFVSVATYVILLFRGMKTFRTETDFEIQYNSARDLLNNTKIKFGAIENGVTSNFLKYSTNPVYKEIYNRSTNVRSAYGGIGRVKRGGYAYFGESTLLEYVSARDCSLIQIGGLLNSNEYGLALPIGSPYNTRVRDAVTLLQQNRVLDELYKKWWHATSPVDCGKLDTNSRAAPRVGAGKIFSTDSVPEETHVIYLNTFVGPLVMLIIGVFISLIFLGVEIGFSRWTK